MGLDAKTRQRQMRARRREGPFKLKSFWVADDDARALQERFPGHSGGIRWGDVVKAALAAQPRW